MKASAYNHFIRAGNRTLAYNAVSNGLALIDDEVLKALRSPESIDPLILSRLQGESATLLRELKRGRFVIESDFDEVEYLRLLYNRAKYDVVAAGLTIAPTLDCNFNCPYCYEEQRSSRMTDEVKQHLCRYVAQIVKVARSFQVTWYGGEPLLCPDVIEELSKEFLKACEENHCAYHAS
ncbi:MAG TPA: 4Fe-4S cluster-binding domain-containing protein, partial [Firmicutes bacterium]|nr:4Fe-4S cluster-binding domain-containing protein [Bacillota bacterium]